MPTREECLFGYCFAVDIGNFYVALLTTFFTALLVVVAWQQLRNAIRQQKLWATLQACDRYDSDPVISASARIFYNISEKRISFDPSREQELGDSVRTVLNFFEAISIGLKQGMYDEDIIYEHLGSIMINRRKELRNVDNRIFKEYYECLTTDFIEYNKVCDKFERRRREDANWKS
ncbi:DUF4760 domain-containing protein [uncultured Ferrovibrio sp.]|jgi:hypothetical protein|uniref:DUF4760 domain-containing protein n=1 Tax=uncultured Ferrovibrio sp. TaxID=1576913 RepID=UPI00261126F9|nr:DUF4760 domain-containing protein [uncultured Ferrovibrio sp.]